MSDWLFKAHFEYPPKWWTCSAVTWLVPRETAAVSARSVYTIQPCTISRHFIAWVRACLALTCHLHFWQNNRDFLRASAVTRRWNGYRNKIQRRKLTLQEKILPPLLPGLEPGTFNHESDALTTDLSPLPHCVG